MATLPEESLLEIFFWLPVKSLIRFRCLSKSFCELIYSPNFVKTHFNQSTKSGSSGSEVILTKGCRAFSLPFNLDGHIVKAIEIYCPMKVSKVLQNNSLLKESILVFVGSSCGILCFEERDLKRVFGITLWNPSTGQCRNVKLTSSCNSTSNFSLGYDPLEDDHKVLKIVQYCLRTRICYEVEVYSLKRNSWKKINQSFPYHLWDFATGVSVHGAVHWPAVGSSDHAVVSSDLVIIAAFDLGAETFRQVPAPPEGHGTLMNLGDLGDRLCAFYRHDEGNFEGRSTLFVMQDYGIKESWTNLFTIETRYQSDQWHPIAYFQDRGKAVLEKDKLLFFYDPKKKSGADNIRLLGLPPDVPGTITLISICFCNRSLTQL